MFGLTSAAVALAVIYLLFSNFRLRRRLGDLEAAIRGLQRPQTPDAPEQPDVETLSPEAEKTRKSPALSERAAASGPWTTAKAAVTPPGLRPSPPDAASPPKAFVFKEENLRSSGRWLAENWFLAVAALSLALAGVFLVQYGVENGLLSPFMRVIGAASFGVALIWGGEFVRRRWGDGRADHTAYLPSTFAGAGLVALFAAVLSARALYGLIGAEATLVYLVMVSGVAVVLGWYYGPFLAVVGILGSVAAPFLVGGQSQSPELFFYYFAIVAVAALAVDTVKRWAWVSVLALILTFGAAWYIWTLGAADEHFLAFALIMVVASVTIPRRSLWPDHDGAAFLDMLGAKIMRGGKSASGPEFPTRLAVGAFAGAAGVAMLVALKDTGAAEVWLAVAGLSVLYVAATVWFRRARALDDLALLPPILLLGIMVWQSQEWGSLYDVFRQGIERAPETSPPMTVTVFAVLAATGSALAFWRCLWWDARAQIWAAGAALFAPLMIVLLEIWWDPEGVLGTGFWAAHGIVVAGLMVLFAGQVARRDGEDKRRVAYFALAALTMITFALVVILSSAALTIALAVMVLGAALIDRRLNLPLLGFFVQVGVIAIGWRLVLDPGVSWASRAPLWEVLLAYLGSAGLLAAAWLVLAERGRDTSRVTVESGIWAMLGVLASVLLSRVMGSGFESHYGFSLFASVWLMLMLVQLYRMRSGGVMRWVRIGLAVIYGLVAAFLYMLMATIANPLNGGGETVVGPPIFDSLLVALGVPALVLAVGVWKLPGMNRLLRTAFITLAAGFAAAYVGLEVRRLWRGRDLSAFGPSSGELYTYTVAMMLASVALLFLAFSRRSLSLRRIATIGIALTIAKVFLIDMAGLAGLLRVASFLGLGLSLAALGWVYRRMADQWDAVTVDK